MPDAEKLLVKGDAGLFSFINQGELTIDGVNDAEEMRLTDVRLLCLHFYECLVHSHFTRCSNMPLNSKRDLSE